MARLFRPLRLNLFEEFGLWRTATTVIDLTPDHGNHSRSDKRIPQSNAVVIDSGEARCTLNADQGSNFLDCH